LWDSVGFIRRGKLFFLADEAIIELQKLYGYADIRQVRGLFAENLTHKWIVQFGFSAKIGPNLKA
jgi:hypothetical protein